MIMMPTKVKIGEGDGRGKKMLNIYPINSLNQFESENEGRERRHRTSFCLGDQLQFFLVINSNSSSISASIMDNAA